jgi:lipoprotein-anchoring transpeptidase ErfK/SrfK
MRAATWILVPVLAAGCAGSSGKHEAKREPPARERVAAPPAQAQQEHTRRVRPRPPAAKPRPHAARPKPPAVRQAKQKTRQRPNRALPWQPDGTSLVAHARHRFVHVYASPRAKRPRLVLRNPVRPRTPRAFLVQSERKKWLHVYLPTRPNGSMGWVRRDAVRVYTNRYRLVVRLRRHMLQLWRGDDLLAKFPVAVGTPSTPTPRGLFYIVELLQPSRPSGTYGPYSFGISAHSNVLKRFAGADGRVGLHGTNEPGLIGSDVSHGCIRVRNGPIRRLARILPLGTPVYVRS